MKQTSQLVLGIVVMAAVCTSSAWARTWRVAADHSGDWWDLYTAVLAAGDGDTLSIAPGRYDYLVTGIVDGYGVIALWNEPKSLTFIGDHRDSVFIGPASYDASSPGIGPAYTGSPGITQRFEALTFENLYDGLTIWSNIDVSDLIFRNCANIAMDIRWGSNGAIRACLFSEIGVAALRMLAADYVLIEECVFDGVYVTISSGSDNFMVQRSKFRSKSSAPNEPAMNLSFSSGRIEDCEFTGYIVLGDNHDAVLVGNRFVIGDQHSVCLSVYGNGTCVFDGNVVEGGTFAAISIPAADTDLSGSGNHIRRFPGARAVSAHGWHNNSRIDLRGNYWGTASEDSVAAWIFDKHDDPQVYAEVLFSPIEPAPVPAEKKSLGGLKALFLGR